jgi:hypothetical protein
LKKQYVKCELESAGSEWGPVADSYEYGNESSLLIRFSGTTLLNAINWQDLLLEALIYLKVSFRGKLK